MKRPLHHAIVRAPYGGQRVVAVTTEKPSGHWYGRTVPGGEATHGLRRDVISRHQTEPEAQSRLGVMSSIEAQYSDRCRTVVSLTRRLQQMREDAIRDAATGAVPPPLPTLDVLWSDRTVSAQHVLDACDRFIREGDSYHGDFERDVVALLERHTP